MVHGQHPSSAKAGETVIFSANSVNSTTPVVSYRWNFGDGVSRQGSKVSHAYTHAGNYAVKLSAQGLDGLQGKDKFQFPVTGSISTDFAPTENRRYQSNH